MIYTPFAKKVLELITKKESYIGIYGGSIQVPCYLGLSSTTPAADGTNFTEPDAETYPSYKRVLLNSSNTQFIDIFGEIANGEVTNAKEFSTAECREAGGWPTFTHFGIFDCETGGVPLCGDLLTDPDGSPDGEGNYPAKTLTVALNNVAVFRAESLKLKLQ